MEQFKPKRVIMDNGPEFISKEFRKWCAGKDIEVHYIQPVGQCKMVTLNGLTEHSGKIFLTSTYLTTLCRYKY